MLAVDGTPAMKRILIIDDDVNFGELTRRRLERLGFVVKFHPGSMGAMPELLTGKYDAVLLDMNMPGLAGPDVMRLIRSSSSSGIKVMFFSSMDVPELRRLAEAHGADGYISKGASSNEFEVRLKAMMGYSG